MSDSDDDEHEEQTFKKMARSACVSFWNHILNPDTIQVLSLDTNALFSVSGHRDDDCYILRITEVLYHTKNDLLAELLWLESLARDTDLMVRCPVRTIPDDSLFGEVDLPDNSGNNNNHHPRFVTLFRRVPGVHIEEDLSESVVRSWGVLSASLHEHAKGFTLPSHVRVRTYDTVFPFAEYAKDDEKYAGGKKTGQLDRVLSSVPNLNLGIDIGRADRYSRLEQVVNDEILWLRQQHDSTQHLIHNDLHTWNVLLSTQNNDQEEGHKQPQLSVIDFEDVVIGHAVQDIAVSLFYIQNYRNVLDYMEAFRIGYETVAPWPVSPDRKNQLKLFMLGRQLALVNYFLNLVGNEQDLDFARMEMDKLDRSIAKFLYDQIYHDAPPASNLLGLSTFLPDPNVSYEVYWPGIRGYESPGFYPARNIVPFSAKGSLHGIYMVSFANEEEWYYPLILLSNGTVREMKTSVEDVVDDSNCCVTHRCNNRDQEEEEENGVRFLSDDTIGNEHCCINMNAAQLSASWNSVVLDGTTRWEVYCSPTTTNQSDDKGEEVSTDDSSQSDDTGENVSTDGSSQSDDKGDEVSTDGSSQSDDNGGEVSIDGSRQSDDTGEDASSDGSSSLNWCNATTISEPVKEVAADNDVPKPAWGKFFRVQMDGTDGVSILNLHPGTLRLHRDYIRA